MEERTIFLMLIGWRVDATKALRHEVAQRLRSSTTFETFVNLRALVPLWLIN